MKESKFYCDAIIDIDEYKKMVRYFQKGIYLTLLITGILISIVLAGFVAIITKELAVSLVVVFLLLFLFFFFCTVRYEKIVEGFYKRSTDSEVTYFENEFFKSYFIRKNDELTRKIEYSKITKCIETNSNLYLQLNHSNQIIIFQKDRMSVALLSFLEERLPPFEKHVSSENVNRVSIQRRLILLFICTLLSVFGALGTLLVVTGIPFDENTNILSNM